MELFLPEQIALNETSKALIGDVEKTARRVFEYRPLPAAVVKRVEDSLLGERVYSSNAIEGNTLDLRETVTVLNTGRILENKKRDAIEARNLGEAVQRVSQLVSKGTGVHTVPRILEIHKLILRETPDEYWGGRFREQRVLIEGAKHQPPDHSMVPTLVERVLEQLQKPNEVPGIVTATWAHWALARIHPFKDGNGRTSRLWQDLVLFQNNLTCAIITPEQRKDYLEALTRADDGSFDTLVQLVAQRTAMTFDRYLTELEQENEATAFVRELVGEADAQEAEKRRLQYQRWARQMERLRWEFETCAARITEAAKDVRIQSRPYEMIDQGRWENIRKSRPADRTLCFTMTFDGTLRQRRYRFFFGKHFCHEQLDSHEDRLENRVCLLISEDDGSGSFKRLDEVENCPISTREIFLVKDKFVVRVFDQTQVNKSSYDRDVLPIKIAQDFIRDVVLRRLT